MAKMTKVDVLNNFITHHQDRLHRALEAGPLTPQQEETGDALVFAVEALKSRDLFEVASAFLRLGMAVERERVPDDQTLWKWVSSHMGRLNQDKARESGERAKTRAVKCDVQKEAGKLWDADTEQKIRTGSMYDKIFRTLERKVKDAGISMPIENTVKGWLREIAPEYAKKGGAPKKD